MNDMDKAFWIEGVKSNWWLIAIMVLCLAVPAGRFLLGPTHETGGILNTPQPPSAAGLVDSSQLDARRNQDPFRTKRMQEALETIAKHEARLEANPATEEATSLLNAMGNLYCMRLQDYEKASHCYRRALEENGDALRNRDSYIGLARCYEKAGEPIKANQVYLDMKAAFPPDSQEYAFAEAKLRGRI